MLRTNRQDAKRAKISWGLNDSLEPSPEDRYVERDQKAQRKFRSFQVGDDLGHVNGCNGLRHLELDHEAFINEQIQARFAGGFSLVGDADWNLPGKANAAQHKLDRVRLFLSDVLKKTAKTRRSPSSEEIYSFLLACLAAWRFKFPCARPRAVNPLMGGRSKRATPSSIHIASSYTDSTKPGPSTRCTSIAAPMTR